MYNNGIDLDPKGCRKLAAAILHRAILDLRADPLIAYESRRWMATQPAALLAGALGVAALFENFVARGARVDLLPPEAFKRKIWL